MMPTHTWLTRRARIAIMCSLFAAFFIISPIVIFYTAGYRFDWERMRILQTGVISVDIRPRTATVALNDVVIDKRIPLRLTNRAPSMYHLSLSAPGYHSWKEVITVSSNQTTYVRDITLFRDALPTHIDATILTASTTLLASPYPSQTLMLHTIEDDTIHEFGIYTPRTDTYRPMIRTSASALTHVSWPSMATPLVAIQLETPEGTIATYQINLSAASVTTPIETAEVPLLHWSEDTVYIEKNNTWIAATTPEQVYSSVVPTTETTENWYLAGSSESIVTDPQSSSTLTFEEPIRAIIGIFGDTIIAQSETQILQFQKNEAQARLVSSWNAADTDIVGYQDGLLLITPWEVQSIAPNGATTLLLRTSNAIQHLALLDADTPELVLTHDQSVEVYDPRYNSYTTLYQNSTVGGIQVGTNRAAVYMQTTVGRQQGLFELAF